MTTVLYLFDIDGTLLHAHGSGRGAFDAVMAEHHGIVDASNGIRYGGKTDPAIIDEIYQARLGRRATPAEHAAGQDMPPGGRVPFALSLIGLAIIAAGLWLNRNHAAVSATLDRRMPETLQRLRPRRISAW